MTAVKKVAIAGSGVAATRRRHPARQGRRRGRRLRGEARAQRARLRHLAAGQRPARVRRARRVGRHPRRRLPVRGPEPPRARTRRADRRASCPTSRPAVRTTRRQMGMPRADLARILLEHAEQAGANVRFGAKVTGLDAGATTDVEVFVNDESAGVYDLLIGADGLNSTVRELIGIDDEAASRPGMGIWRTFVSRPAEVVRTELYYGGPVYIAGYTPTGEDSMYAFLVEKAAGPVRHPRRRGHADHARRVARVRRPVELDPRRPRSAARSANYTWFTQHIVDGAVEPRPRRRHRRCRAQLPADDRAGRGPGARGRARADRAARRARCASTRTCGTPSTRGACRARRRSSRHPSSSASGSSTASATPTSPGLMFGIAQQMAEPA